ncbi:MAG: nuclear transport factor 2 family protein [Thermoleophilia bacterium]
MSDVSAATDGFYAALNAAFGGDAAPTREVWSARDDVALTGPFGGRLVGHDAVLGQFRELLDMGMTGHIGPIDVRLVQVTDVGYALGVEQGHNVVYGTRTDVRHRFTSAFRLEDGRWRMTHHHTDLTTFG